MSRFLPDVNVLIAIIDAGHEFHEAASVWIAGLDKQSEWFSCPITENGAVRIMSGAHYPTGALPVPEVVDALQSLGAIGQHRFIGDTLSITDPRYFAADRIAGSKRLTDAYMVALAAAHDATFVTLDHRLATAGVVSPDAQVVFLTPPR